MSPQCAEMPMLLQPYCAVPPSLHSKSMTQKPFLNPMGNAVPSISNKMYSAYPL